MSEARQLGALQLAILRLLWEKGEGTAGEVHQGLKPHRDLAPTTIATMLAKMEKKRLVDHRAEGRVFVYRALVDQSQVNRSMVSEFVDRLFLGDPLALVNHLISEGELAPSELTALKRRIAEQKRAKGGGRE